MKRPNNAASFPRHVFIRAANLNANAYDRVGNRYQQNFVLIVTYYLELIASRRL